MTSEKTKGKLIDHTGCYWWWHITNEGHFSVHDGEGERWVITCGDITAWERPLNKYSELPLGILMFGLSKVGQRDDVAIEVDDD